jgi:hypothetical protein
MILPTAGPPADTTRLREQIVTAREALTTAVASLDGAMEAAQDREVHLYAPLARLVMTLCDSLGSVRSAERWLTAVERALEQQVDSAESGR